MPGRSHRTAKVRRRRRRRSRRSARSGRRRARCRGAACSRPRDRGQARAQRLVGEQAVDRRPQLAPARGRRWRRRTPKPVSSMRWALSYWSQNSGSTTIGLPKCRHSVTVLLPPWVITRSTCGRIDGLGQELLAGHVVGELELGVLRAHARRSPGRARRRAMAISSASARRRPSRASRGSGRRAGRRREASGSGSSQAASVVAHAGLEVVPRRSPSGAARGVVDLARVEPQVELRGLVHELELRQRRRAALAAELVERRAAAGRARARTRREKASQPLRSATG